jgi:3-hydroxyisobutyrate dehydrogenase-like beta-hydroxyacid dehydrogenase
MGGRIARRTIETGQPVSGYDRDPATLAAAGVTPVGSIAELVADSDVVLLSLPDSKVIEAVVFGDDGVLAHARDGQVVIDLSTAAPESTVRICEALDERGATFLDAGISGGAAAAEKGTLTLMVGGDEERLTDVMWLLERFATKVFYMGPSGNGHVTKLLNNFLNAIALAATAEVMVAARKADLDLERVLEVFNASSGVNFATLNRFPKMIHGDYLEGGLSGELMAKDVMLYLGLTQQLGVPTLNGPSCLATFQVVNQMGYGKQISNRVVDGLGDLAGGIRIHDQASSGASAGQAA